MIARFRPPVLDVVVEAISCAYAFARGVLGLRSAARGDDLIKGNLGDDKAGGRSGNDTFDGGAGNDRVSGGEGEDEIHGGAGDDIDLDGDHL